MPALLRVLVALVLTAAGLSIAAAPAGAACTYGMCVQTVTKIKAPASVKAGKTLQACVEVDARTNIRPLGTVRLEIKGPGGYSKSSRQDVGRGGRACFRQKLTKAGTYKLSATFKGEDGYRDSKDADSVKVKKKKS